MADRTHRSERRAAGARAGLTLLEMLVALVVLGILAAGLARIVDAALTGAGDTETRQQLLAQGRRAMERMAWFVQETDAVQVPSGTNATEGLAVNERALDTFANATRAFAAGGDGRPDADKDADGAVHDDATSDPVDMAVFFLDKTNRPACWALVERVPDYGTAAFSDFRQSRLCENVAAFQCRRLATNLLEIALSLSNGSAQVSLRTRVTSRFIEP